MLFGGGFVINEETAEEVTATVAPSLKVIAEDVETLTLWEKVAPYAYWIGGILLIVIIAYIIYRLLKRKEVRK